MRAAAIRSLWRNTPVKLATFAGHAVGTAPGAVGALLVSYGAHQVWSPLGWIVLGGFLLAVDRRVP